MEGIVCDSIIQHSSFAVNCLNHYVFDISLYEYNQDTGPLTMKHLQHTKVNLFKEYEKLVPWNELVTKLYFFYNLHKSNKRRAGFTHYNFKYQANWSSYCVKNNILLKLIKSILQKDIGLSVTRLFSFSLCHDVDVGLLPLLKSMLC